MTTQFLLACVNLWPSLCLLQLVYYSLRPTTLIFISIPDGLNLSLAQGQLQSPDNRTIQTVVKAYLEEFVGRCTQEKMT